MNPTPLNNDDSVDEPEPMDPSIREGSPFLPGSEEPLHSRKPSATPLTTEQIHDLGVLKYTAMGAVAASILVAIFAGIALFWFPAGGILIAALGCILALFGLTSHYQRTAAGMLLVHLFLFLSSYSKNIGF